MDTISHALYGKGFFGYKKYRWASFVFGAIPDLASFGVYFIFEFLFHTEGFEFGRPTVEEIPFWVYRLYDISHSLITATIFIVVGYLINKDFAWVMLGWPVHIIVDFFTHSIDFFPTPIFWPVSDFRFDGIPWANPYILAANLLLLFLIFVKRWRAKP